MAIRKRNLATGAKLSSAMLTGNAGGTAVTVASANRSSLTVNEVGVTIVLGSSTNTTTAASGGTIIFYAVKPGIDPTSTTFPFASMAIGASATVGNEYTTRDGSMSFYDNSAGSDGSGGTDKDYRNAGSRVFPKGTLFRAVWSGGTDTGNDGDVFACWGDFEEYGAAPAVG